eukprot:jgi/Mesvir1/18307/Mv18461-RA.1
MKEREEAYMRQRAEFDEKLRKDAEEKQRNAWTKNRQEEAKRTFEKERRPPPQAPPRRPVRLDPLPKQNLTKGEKAWNTMVAKNEGWNANELQAAKQLRDDFVRLVNMENPTKVERKLAFKTMHPDKVRFLHPNMNTRGMQSLYDNAFKYVMANVHVPGQKRRRRAKSVRKVAKKRTRALQ